VQELEAVQSVYSDEGVTEAQAEIVTVPAFTLSSIVPPKKTLIDNKQKKKTPTPKVELDTTPVKVVKTVIVLRPITGMDENKVSVSVHLKLIFQTKVTNFL
jgi:hypothetical protein